ncbi:UbiE/COQ5 family methyltransferase [Natrialba aegyptia DSM 13077]|uniref:UbiE/COQ5 family methyltransferase n=2 Tax=Natrialba aegyptia TaxID=129789 RepID=M0APM4_9EURY|nr:UbiE/COQ5 family methyltransferase [Natrialba aegyptia DSM 13077]
MKQIFADLINLSANDRVLDCSGGLGDNATWIAREYGAKTIGVNINRLQLGLARELAIDRNVKSLTEFRHDDFTQLETVENDSVDVVWAIESICYAEDKRDFLEQAKRVLKPKGRIVISDWFLDQRDFSKIEQFIMRKWLEGWKVPNYAHIDDFRENLSQLGFKNIRRQDATENTLPSARVLYLFSLWDYPLSKVLNAVGLREQLRLENTTAIHYMYYAYKLRLITYSIVAAKL